MLGRALQSSSYHMINIWSQWKTIILLGWDSGWGLKGKRHQSRGNCLIGIRILQLHVTWSHHCICPLFVVTYSWCIFILSCRFTGTIVGCENLDPLWPDSSWRYLKVNAYSMFTVSIMVLNLCWWRIAFFINYRCAGMSLLLSRDQIGSLLGR
jgi:hypothetical protein